MIIGARKRVFNFRMLYMSENSSKPYLIRALYEWCIDNQQTPYLTVLVDENTQVPSKFVFNGQIVLNISYEAVAQLQISNEFVECKARFDGKRFDIVVPVNNIIAIYSKENGQGMTFNVEIDKNNANNKTNNKMDNKTDDKAENKTGKKASPLVLLDLDETFKSDKTIHQTDEPIFEQSESQTELTDRQKIDIDENNKENNKKSSLKAHLKLIK